jgi:hypothetical protein
VKAAQNSQRSKVSNAVLLTQSRAAGGGGVKSFRGLEACNLVTAPVLTYSCILRHRNRCTFLKYVVFGVPVSFRPVCLVVTRRPQAYVNVRFGNYKLITMHDHGGKYYKMCDVASFSFYSMNLINVRLVQCFFLTVH